MLDLLVIVIVLAFLVAALLYVRGCDRVAGKPGAGRSGAGLPSGATTEPAVESERGGSAATARPGP
jgi:hypothetical protein